MDFRNWRELFYKAHDLYEHYKERLRPHLPTQEKVEKSHMHTFFGSTLLRKELWSFDHYSVARGLALGLFASVTPTMGFQWFVVAFLILFFPGNLPVALLACLFTNPFTTPFVLFLEYVVGAFVLQWFGFQMQNPAEIDFSHLYDFSSLSHFASQAGLAIVTGSMIFGPIIGLAGYVFVHGFIMVENRIKRSKLKRKGGAGKNISE